MADHDGWLLRGPGGPMDTRYVDGPHPYEECEACGAAPGEKCSPGCAEGEDDGPQDQTA